jgi:hypothetical protein
MATQNLNLPLSFRSREVRRVMDAIRAGESCALIGVGSSGKSNVLRFIARPDVQAHYLRSEWSPRLFVMVDGDGLGDDHEDRVYRLLLERLVATLREQLSGADEADWAGYEQMVNGLMVGAPASGAIQGLFNRAVAFLQERGCHLAFLLDNFDEAFRHCDPAIFAGLRALRNDHKYRLVYVVAARRELDRLAEPSPRFTKFIELFAQNTLYLGPYVPDDAALMLTRLANRHQITLAPEAAEHLVRATGGHPGLLRAAFGVAKEAALPAGWPALLRRLTHERSVREECRKLIESLDLEERRSIESIALGLAERPRSTHTLNAKGLIITRATGQSEVFSPLLREYVLETSNRRRPGDELEPDATDLYG